MLKIMRALKIPQNLKRKLPYVLRRKMKLDQISLENGKNLSTAKLNWAKIFILVVVKKNIISFHSENFLRYRNFCHIFGRPLVSIYLPHSPPCGRLADRNHNRNRNRNRNRNVKPQLDNRNTGNGIKIVWKIFHKIHIRQH